MAEIRPLNITSKKNKIDINYRNCEKCQMCDFFQGGGCSLVEGSISPEGTCDLWQIRSAMPKYKDGQFYIDEYKKATTK
jgi:hypothetical protein